MNEFNLAPRKLKLFLALAFALIREGPLRILPANLMKCPDCQHPLILVEYREVEIDLCSHCSGCWLDGEELGFLLHGEFRHLDEIDAVRGPTGSRRCPLCRKRLRVGPFAESGIEVDVCTMGHGIWLDRGELKELMDLHGRDTRLLPLSLYLNDMFADTPESDVEQAAAPVSHVSKEGD